MIFRSNGEIWLRADDRVSTIFQGHPFIDNILLPSQEPPSGTNVVLNIQEANDCPSIRSLMAGSKINASRLFCDAAIVDRTPVVYDGRAPKLYFTEQEKQRIQFIRRSIKKRKVGVQVKGGHWWKTYPHLKKLVDLLRNVDDVQVFLTHDGDIPFKHKGIIPLTALNYRDLMIWLGAMDLFIGFDSGPTHLAASVGTRTYGIYGPTDPQEILGMYGTHVSWNKFAASQCPRKHCWLRPCKKLLCLKALNPWAILKDVEGILKEGYVNQRIRPEASPIVRPEILRETIHLPASPMVIVPDGIDSGRVALMRLDGLGGTVTLSDHAKKLYEQTGDKVTLVTRGYDVLFADNPHVKTVIDMGSQDMFEVVGVMRQKFDLLVDIRFSAAKWLSSNGTRPLCESDIDITHYYDEFPTDCRDLEKYGLHHVQLTNKSLGLPFDTIDTHIYSGDEAVSLDSSYDDGYVLINNGVDVHHKGMKQTKCWHSWEPLVALIKDLPVIQVGTRYDSPVKGALDLRGETNLKQLIYLLRKSRVIIAGEGGIAHLAYAADVSNVIILGGPTQGVLFEYPGHHWITSYACGNCWGMKDGWFIQCPKDVDVVCMKTISPERVFEAYENMVASS
jgi:ADP-heptose:LPS heptosyltransferase